MISLCAAVYELLMHKVFEKKDDPKSPVLHSEDTDDVYFRFGGAALASMLKLCYDSLKSAPDSKKDSIKAEIKVLKTIECTDKAHIPEYLQYRDRGHMYFPKMCFIPSLEQLINVYVP